MSELQQLLAMFDRCGIPYQRFDEKNDSVRIETSPPADDNDSLYSTRGPLTGDPWASADFRFGPDGRLVGIHEEGE